jgi:hypothetical protein
VHHPPGAPDWLPRPLLRLRLPLLCLPPLLLLLALLRLRLPPLCLPPLLRLPLPQLRPLLLLLALLAAALARRGCQRTAPRAANS